MLHNDGATIGNALENLIDAFDSVSVAVAFAKMNGLAEVRTLERGGRRIRFLAGTIRQNV